MNVPLISISDIISEIVINMVKSKQCYSRPFAKHENSQTIEVKTETSL